MPFLPVLPHRLRRLKAIPVLPHPAQRRRGRHLFSAALYHLSAVPAHRRVLLPAAVPVLLRVHPHPAVLRVPAALLPVRQAAAHQAAVLRVAVLRVAVLRVAVLRVACLLPRTTLPVRIVPAAIPATTDAITGTGTMPRCPVLAGRRRGACATDP